MKKITITSVISVALLFLCTSATLNASNNYDGTSNNTNLFASVENSISDYLSEKFKQDEDGDGVKDKKDECPGTPKDVIVDEKGCPVDNDKDGVADFLDKCPQTVGLVGLNGCPDKDNDGVADNDDNCAEVPGLARFMGCPDSDADGIEDSKDKCPNAKGSDLFKGCPDTDGDGVEDAMDKCANSEKGVKVDATGCVADSDRDGIADSDDKCPDTQKGIKVDAKGCAADTDGDGIIDSNDKCPTTKAEGTTNGCPVVKPDVKKRLDFAARGTDPLTPRHRPTPDPFPARRGEKQIPSSSNFLEAFPSARRVRRAVFRGGGGARGDSGGGIVAGVATVDRHAGAGGMGQGESQG